MSERQISCGDCKETFTLKGNGSELVVSTSAELDPALGCSILVLRNKWAMIQVADVDNPGKLTRPKVYCGKCVMLKLPLVLMGKGL